MTAGSWLIGSVCIDRTIAMSSTISPRCGSSSEISTPSWPYRLEPVRGADHQQLRLPAGHPGDPLAVPDRGGQLLAGPLREDRLGVEQVDVRRAARHEQVDDPLRLGGEVEARAGRPGSSRAGAGRRTGRGSGARPGPSRRSRWSTGRGTGGGSSPGRSRRSRARAHPLVMVSSRFRSTLPIAVQAASSAGSRPAGRADSPTLISASAAFGSARKWSSCRR